MSTSLFSTRPEAMPEATPPEAEGLVQQPSLGSQLGYSPIVVAVTGGEDGAGPVRLAAELQRRYGSRVLAVQVLDTSGMPLPIPLPTAFTFARELIGDAPYARDARA